MTRGLPGNTGRSRLIDASIESLLQAAQLDPHGLTFPIRLMEAFAEFGPGDKAAVWARRCLELDGLMRLDPIRGMTDSQRRQAERLAGGP